MFRKLINHRQRFSWHHLANAFATTALLFIATHSTLMSNAEFNTRDARFKLRGPITSEGQTVIVGIDQQSYDDMGQTFPWPRSYHAKLLENLTRAGARLVIFDLIFDAPGNDAGGDSAFAAAIANHGQVILGAKMQVLRNEVSGYRLTCPVEPLRSSAAAIGLVDRLEDSDGFTRRYRLSVPAPEGEMFSLGLEAIRLYHGVPADSTQRNEGGIFKIGASAIPRVDATSFIINYRGVTGAIPTYSYSSVIDDASFELPAGMDVDAFEFQKELFRDKVVLVGATMAEMQDFVRSPFFEIHPGERILTPGVEMHANAIESILSGQYYKRLSRLAEVALLLLLALLASSATIWFRPVIGHGAAFLIACAYVAIALWLFIEQRLILSVVAPVGVVFVCHGINILYFFVKEQRERRRIKGMFATYVPEKVVNALIENPSLMNLGGEERELTILFSDLAGFTRFSESLTPTELVQLLNEYLSEMTDIILEHNGIIDKYEGDLIMAEFGAPLFDPQHALRASQAALAMQCRLDELREIWRGQGREPLFARIGLNTGSVVLGNMGSHAVHDYTVLGDAVNLASRLEGANKVYGTEIMISESTFTQIQGHLPTRELDYLRVIGKAQAVTVFELLNVREAVHDQFALGLAAYRGRDWTEAVSRFSKALECNPADNPARIFLERAKCHQANPPDGDWDGVFAMSWK